MRSELLVARHGGLCEVSTLHHDLGLARVASGAPGWLATSQVSGVILADRDLALRGWGADAVAALADRFVPYVVLDGACWPTPACGFGTHEQVSQTASGPPMLVEQVA